MRSRFLIQGSYLLLFLALTLPASSPTSAREQKQNQSLTVATVDNFLPCSDKYHNGYRGLSIDLWHTISARNSINYKLKPVSTFNKAVEAAANNDVDLVISCHEINKERARLVDFSVPYTYGGIGILSRKKGGLTFSFINRLLANEKIVRCTLLLLIATSLAALVLKRGLKGGISYSLPYNSSSKHQIPACVCGGSGSVLHVIRHRALGTSGVFLMCCLLSECLG